MSDKPLRDLMPESAAIVDAFRNAGLTDNDALREGMRHGGFYARENRQEIGKRTAEEGATPVLSFEAEKRIADVWWKREQGGE